MTASEFFRDVSLYKTLFMTWKHVGADVVADAELAGYNQPAYDEATDAEIRPVVLVFKSALQLTDETRGFSIPANGDAQVLAQTKAVVGEQKDLGVLELFCEVQRYPANGDLGSIDYVTLRLQFAGVEIIDTPAM